MLKSKYAFNIPCLQILITFLLSYIFQNYNGICFIHQGDGKKLVPRTPKPPTPQARLPKRFVPKYHGENLAFSIQLFCVDERFEMRLVPAV